MNTLQQEQNSHVRTIQWILLSTILLPFLMKQKFTPFFFGIGLQLTYGYKLEKMTGARRIRCSSFVRLSTIPYAGLSISSLREPSYTFAIPVPVDKETNSSFVHCGIFRFALFGSHAVVCLTSVHHDSRN